MNNYLDPYRDAGLLRRWAEKLQMYQGRPIKLMEVCGTHTMAIARYGIRSLLPDGIQLISGPGCPVCVTPSYYINNALELARRPGVIVATFGDLMRIPGDEGSLLGEKARGADIRVLYSPLDVLKIARDNPERQVVLLSVGFETTTPIAALTVIKACQEGLSNYTVLSANKTMPEVLKILANDPFVGIDGYLYPGHVSAIIGTGFYEEMAEEYGVPGVVAGFEPLDILAAVAALAEICNGGRQTVQNLYSRVVKPEGNPVAVQTMEQVFEPTDAVWRGIGMIPGSGLAIREEYARFDAWKVFDLRIADYAEPEGCQCGEILKGKKTPNDCPLFGTRCVPEKPVGACMVSSEGTCAAHYKYGGNR